MNGWNGWMDGMDKFFLLYFSLSFLLLILHSSYLINQGVCYLCVSDKLFPKRLAFSYLEELSSEFYARHGKEIETVQRPYAFIQFGKLNSSMHMNCMILDHA